jgi:hypothetical protein
VPIMEIIRCYWGRVQNLRKPEEARGCHQRPEFIVECLLGKRGKVIFLAFTVPSRS